MSPFRLDADFVLASASPRRRRLLDRLGFDFRVVVSDADETVPSGTPPAKMVETLALRKADVVAGEEPSALVLGADTIVVLDGTVLEKPGDADQARAMLHRLSGRTHTVFTGIAIVHPPSGRRVATHERTRVTFDALDDDEVEAYVATGSSLDKAGSYGIQDDLGALFVAGIDGDYYNVVGLPLHRLYHTLRQHFSDVFSLVPA